MLEMLGVGGASFISRSPRDCRKDSDAADDRFELREDEAIDAGRGGGVGIFEAIWESAEASRSAKDCQQERKHNKEITRRRQERG